MDFVDFEKIRGRLAGVAWLKEDPVLREKLRGELKEIYDLERLNGRIALGRANARDLLALKTSITRLPFIKEMVENISRWSSMSVNEILSDNNFSDLTETSIEEQVYIEAEKVYKERSKVMAS